MRDQSWSTSLATATSARNDPRTVQVRQQAAAKATRTASVSTATSTHDVALASYLADWTNSNIDAKTLAINARATAIATSSGAKNLANYNFGTNAPVSIGGITGSGTVTGGGDSPFAFAGMEEGNKPRDKNVIEEYPEVPSTEGLIPLVPPEGGWPKATRVSPFDPLGHGHDHPIPLQSDINASEFDLQATWHKLFANKKSLPDTLFFGTTWNTGWPYYDDFNEFSPTETIKQLKKTGFTEEIASRAFSLGCFYIAGARMGIEEPTFHLVYQFPVYTDPYSAWDYLQQEASAGKKVRLVVFLGSEPPQQLPTGFDTKLPLPSVVLDPNGEEITPITSDFFDYVVLHHEPKRNMFYWEGIHNKGGGLWRSFNLEHGAQGFYRYYIVVVVTPEMARAGFKTPKADLLLTKELG